MASSLHEEIIEIRMVAMASSLEPFLLQLVLIERERESLRGSLKVALQSERETPVKETPVRENPARDARKHTGLFRTFLFYFSSLIFNFPNCESSSQTNVRQSKYWPFFQKRKEIF